MHAPSVPQTPIRTAITPYARDDSQPLRVLRLDADNCTTIEERRRRWAPYLTGAPLLAAPLATRFVPLLACADPVDDAEIAWPATLYPAGFRNQVLGHCAIEPAASWVAESRRPDGVIHRISQARGLSAEAGDWPARDRLRLALTFNTLSLYRATVQVLGRYARLVETDPHLTYEVARAAYQIGATARALQVFAALSGAGCASLPIRLNAASRLVAHYARSGRDLDACGHWVDASTAMLSATVGGTDFATGLAVSRVHRAAALYASRRRDAAAVAATLQAADAVDRAVEPLADGELRQLELRQNERLILEAALKAYVATGGRVDPLGAAASADRLADLDPWDPYTRLTVGDARWVLGDDGRALLSYDVAARMGTLVGAHAAHRGAVLLARVGRRGEAKLWLARAVALDPAAASEEVSGG
jgi:tetratricopeptide (TPR) repeat protein